MTRVDDRGEHFVLYLLKGNLFLSPFQRSASYVAVDDGDVADHLTSFTRGTFCLPFVDTLPSAANDTECFIAFL